MKVKFENDTITNKETGEQKQIVATSKLPCGVKDLGIGIGIIGVGLLWLLKKTFEHGAKSYSLAEFEAYEELDLLKPIEIENEKEETK